MIQNEYLIWLVIFVCYTELKMTRAYQNKSREIHSQFAIICVMVFSSCWRWSHDYIIRYQMNAECSHNFYIIFVWDENCVIIFRQLRAFLLQQSVLYKIFSSGTLWNSKSQISKRFEVRFSAWRIIPFKHQYIDHTGQNIPCNVKQILQNTKIRWIFFILANYSENRI